MEIGVLAIRDSSIDEIVKMFFDITKKIFSS